jgi:hypothetical protein
MAHDVLFSIPERSLGIKDVVFVVKSDGETFGTLKVSKGSLVWFPTGTRNGFKIEWPKFDRVMKEQANLVERR